jgi:hypothetical protein
MIEGTLPIPPRSRTDSPQERLGRWQTARSWARLIREAEALWFVDVRALRRLGSEELLHLLAEVPPGQRRRVDRWLQRFHVSTRLGRADPRPPCGDPADRIMQEKAPADAFSGGRE